MAEEALLNCCKAMGALGQVYMGEFRTDCAAYIVKHNKRFQLRLNEQQFLDLFLGGILKLGKLNMAWHTKSQELLALAQATPEGRLQRRVDGLRHVQGADRVRPAEAHP